MNPLGFNEENTAYNLTGLHYIIRNKELYEIRKTTPLVDFQQNQHLNVEYM